MYQLINSSMIDKLDCDFREINFKILRVWILHDDINIPHEVILLSGRVPE